MAVKRTLTVPSSRGRGWYCSAAARLQPPVDERPARTAPGLVRPCLSRTRARRRGRARRSPAPRGRRGASFFYVDREHGHARRARWAVRIPPPLIPRHLLPRTAQHLAAHHPAHRRWIGRPSPPSRARRSRAAPSRPACRPAPPRGASSPRLLHPGGRGALEVVALRRVCPVGSPVRAGSSRPRGPLELDPHPPRPIRGHSQLHGGFRRQCDGQKFGIWDKNCGHI